MAINKCACGCGMVARRTWVRGHNRGIDPGYVINDNGCWIYAGYVAPNGYGGTLVGPDGWHDNAHRVYYKRAKGVIPRGYELDHLCGVRACVNPAHLEAVTSAENTRRSRSTKLTRPDVEWIRRYVMRRNVSDARRVWTQQQAAIRFGVTRGLISNIVCGRGWA